MSNVIRSGTLSGKKHKDERKKGEPLSIKKDDKDGCEIRKFFPLSLPTQDNKENLKWNVEEWG